MKKRIIGILLSTVMLIGVLLSFPFAVNAAEEWDAEINSLEHNQISFEISGVECAQKAAVIIDFNPEDDFWGNGIKEDENASSHIELPFTISNSYQQFTLEFPDAQYLEAEHSYKIQIVNESGEAVFSSNYMLCRHLIEYNSYGTIFGITGAIISTSGDTVKDAVVTLNFEQYKGYSDGNGKIYIEYPPQEIGTDLEVVISDGFGCKETFKDKIEKEFDDKDFIIEECDVCPSLAKASYKGWSSTKIRMCAKIADNTYYGEFTDVSYGEDVNITYPVVDPGTDIEIWFEGILGSKTEPQTYNIYNKPGKIEVEDISIHHLECKVLENGYTSQIIESAVITIGDKQYNGKIGSYGEISFDYNAKVGDNYTITICDKQGYNFRTTGRIPNGEGSISFEKCTVYSTIFSFSDYTSEPKSITLTINGKSYSLKKYEEEDYYEGEWCRRADYIVKKGSVVTVKVITKDGYVYTKSCRAKAVVPKLSVNKIYSGDTKIKGKTVAKSAVTIKTSNKVYRTTAGKTGAFSKSIRAYKSGTKITVSVKAPTDCTKSKTVKVKARWGSVSLKNTVYINTTKVKVKVTNARKQDKVKLTVGRKTYIKALKKKGAVLLTFKIKRSSAGDKINIKYTDRFGKKKAYFSKDIVYYGNKIYAGMSEKNCQLTTWGRPVRRNNYGHGLIQWVFKSGSSTLYAYMKNGRVDSIQHLGY